MIIKLKSIQRKTNSLRKLEGRKPKQTVQLKTATYMICNFSYYNAKKLTILKLKKKTILISCMSKQKRSFQYD